MGARYMIVIFDRHENEERPIFVFSEQNIYTEVTKQMKQDVDLQVVVDLLDDAKRQINAACLPEKMLVSRILN